MKVSWRFPGVVTRLRAGDVASRPGREPAWSAALFARPSSRRRAGWVASTGPADHHSPSTDYERGAMASLHATVAHSPAADANSYLHVQRPSWEHGP